MAQKAMVINNIIKYLILFDFVTVSSWGLISPIFAIFVTQQIINGSLKVVGFSSALYMVSFSLARLISAYTVDRKLNDKQRIILSTLGSILIGMTSLFYLFARLPFHVYLLQALNGAGFGLRYSPFMNLFTRYIDKGLESFEWGLNAVSVSLGQAATAALGGLLAEKYGFKVVFLLVGIFTLVGSLIPFVIYKNIPQNKSF
jgi:MFS family permease